MEEVFGLDMAVLMVGVLVAFGLILAGIGMLALANRIAVRIGLRNIARGVASPLKAYPLRPLTWMAAQL